MARERPILNRSNAIFTVAFVVVFGVTASEKLWWEARRAGVDFFSRDALDLLTPWPQIAAAVVSLAVGAAVVMWVVGSRDR